MSISLITKIGGVGLLVLHDPLMRKSDFKFLTSSPNRESFLLDKPIWKLIVPFKVKFLIWTAVLNRINTNDMLQI